MPKNVSPKDIAKLQRKVLTYYRKHGRHTLPWRKTHNPYRILVSEMMLQQTQVERVIPYYLKFIKQYPTVSALARASLGDVLLLWAGLGYNRRAKYLHMAAQELTRAYGGVFPRRVEELQKLPGIGPYTARAICAFAYNMDVVLIETNVRTVLLHEFYPKTERKISDRELEIHAEKCLPRGGSRQWHSALMDYGTYLKARGDSHIQKSKHYIKQKTFKGSDREVRGSILRILSKGSLSYAQLGECKKDKTEAQFKQILKTLQTEGLIELYRNRYRLPR